MSKVENENTDKGVEIVRSYTTLQTGFSGLDTVPKIAKKFNTENINVVRKGKKINVQDWIDSNREGTEIKEVLKKYSGDYTLTAQEMARNRQAIGDALGDIKDLKDYLDQTKKAKELWDGLHGNIKEIFHNNISEFVANGEKWAKGLKDADNKNTSAKNTGQTTGDKGTA